MVLNKIRFKELLYEEAVKLDSFDPANTERRFVQLKEKLFESPDDFDKVMDKP